MSSQFASTPPAAGEADGALLTPTEIAKRLRVKASYLDRLRRRHGLPHVRVGKEIRFNLGAVQGWLEQRGVSQVKNGDAAMSNLAAGYHLNADQKAALRKRVIDLALYRGHDYWQFNRACAELQDQTSRNVLLAVFAAVLLLNAANGSFERVEICERDVVEADSVLNDIVDILLHLTPEMEQARTKFAAGNAGWGENAVTCVVRVGVQVLIIRKIFAARNGQDGPTMETAVPPAVTAANSDLAARLRNKLGIRELFDRESSPESEPTGGARGATGLQRES